MTKFYVIDSAQNIFNDKQATAALPREVDLRGIAGDDNLGVEAQTGKEHFHLCKRRVLCLVQDNERIVQSPTAHIRQRGNFNCAGGHELGQSIGIHHVTQGIVEGTQIGIDLVRQGSRQETQILPGFDRGARENNASDLTREQR